MAQGFYTLEEAANMLGMPADDLNRMAQQRKVRAFADRGTWRFRAQDIDEMVRSQGGAPAAADDPGLDLLDEPLGIADEPAPAVRTSGLQGTAPRQSGFKTPIPPPQDDLVPFDGGLDLKPGSGINHPKTDEDLIPIDDLLDNPPPPPTGGSGLNLGADMPAGKSPSQAPTLKPGGGGAGSDVRLVLDEGSSEFELAVDSSPALEPAAEAPPPSAPRMTGGPLIPDSDPGLDLGLAPGQASVLDSDPDPGLALDLGGEPPPPALDQPPATGGHDSDVRVDFDSSTLDDSMVSIGGPRPDSDVRLDPAAASQVPVGGAPVETLPTEEIDLDAELQEADDASQQRRNKTKPVPGPAMPPGATHMSGEAKGTMLPTSSPFELSEDDLEFSPGDSNVNRPLGSEFELTLAPEDEPSPLNLGDDEDVDLGGLPPKDALSSSARAELSGINLHDPADSGISLEKGGGASDSVDFELTVDEDAAGPKTIKGKIPDSDSEFELTLEDDSNESLPPLEESELTASESGDQKDIFETDFDLPSLGGGDDSHSEAVALDGSDTDLESSDFDLAVSDTDLEKHRPAGVMDESGSEVVVLEEEDEGQTPKRKSRVTGGSLESVDELLLDDDGVEVEDEEEEDEVSPPTIPAAQAEWGMMPILLLVPCVLVMFVAGLMSYELLHGMWGYHAASKPSGMVVRNIAGLFTDDLPKE